LAALPWHERQHDRLRQRQRPVFVHPAARLRYPVRRAYQRQRPVPVGLRPVPVGQPSERRRALQRTAVLPDVLLPAGPVGASAAARAAHCAVGAAARPGRAASTAGAALPTGHRARERGVRVNHLWFQLQGYRDHGRQPLLHDAHERACHAQRREWRAHPRRVHVLVLESTTTAADAGLLSLSHLLAHPRRDHSVRVRDRRLLARHSGRSRPAMGSMLAMPAVERVLWLCGHALHRCVHLHGQRRSHQQRRAAVRPHRVGRACAALAATT
jgi:hypothetical protein